MDKDKYCEVNDKLLNDYLDLCESYQNELPVHEFGFSIIRMASKMLFDCAPNNRVALDTIHAGISKGLGWHMEESV